MIGLLIGKALAGKANNQFTKSYPAAKNADDTSGSPASQNSTFGFPPNSAHPLPNCNS